MFRSANQNANEPGVSMERKFQLAMAALEKSHIFPIEKQTYTCMADCVDGASDRPAVDRCQQKCQAAAKRVQQIVQSEVQRFQTRVQQCLQRCQQSAEDSLPAEVRYGEAISPELRQRLETQMVSLARPWRFTSD